jgi:hypothetical protein
MFEMSAMHFEGDGSVLHGIFLHMPALTVVTVA